MAIEFTRSETSLTDTPTARLLYSQPLIATPFPDDLVKLAIKLTSTQW